MRNMTIPQVQKMVGTTYLHTMGDGSYLPGVIAAFVPNEGFTCLATSLIASDGYDFSSDVNDNGELCLTGLSASDSDFMEAVSLRCREIRDTGAFIIPPTSSGGYASCSIS